MKSKDGFVQAYNAQAAVDAGAQIIVAHELTQCGNDQGQLVPLIDAIENNRPRAGAGPADRHAAKPTEAPKHTHDGSAPDAPSTDSRERKNGGPRPNGAKEDDEAAETPTERKQVVEPVRTDKQARGPPAWRGARKCAPNGPHLHHHNLLKLSPSQTPPEPATAKSAQRYGGLDETSIDCQSSCFSDIAFVSVSGIINTASCSFGRSRSLQHLLRATIPCEILDEDYPVAVKPQLWTRDAGERLEIDRKAER